MLSAENKAEVKEVKQQVKAENKSSNKSSGKLEEKVEKKPEVKIAPVNPKKTSNSSTHANNSSTKSLSANTSADGLIKGFANTKLANNASANINSSREVELTKTTTGVTDNTNSMDFFL